MSRASFTAPDPLLPNAWLTDDVRMFGKAGLSCVTKTEEYGGIEAVNTHEGTHDVPALISGRARTGLQVFY